MTKNNDKQKLLHIFLSLSLIVLASFLIKREQEKKEFIVQTEEMLQTVIPLFEDQLAFESHAFDNSIIQVLLNFDNLLLVSIENNLGQKYVRGHSRHAMVFEPIQRIAEKNSKETEYKYNPLLYTSVKATLSSNNINYSVTFIGRIMSTDYLSSLLLLLASICLFFILRTIFSKRKNIDMINHSFDVLTEHIDQKEEQETLVNDIELSNEERSLELEFPEDLEEKIVPLDFVEEDTSEDIFNTYDQSILNDDFMLPTFTEDPFENLTPPILFSEDELLTTLNNRLQNSESGSLLILRNSNKNKLENVVNEFKHYLRLSTPDIYNSLDEELVYLFVPILKLSELLNALQLAENEINFSDVLIGLSHTENRTELDAQTLLNEATISLEMADKENNLIAFQASKENNIVPR